MAAKSKSKRGSVHSRAARRATSPSINVDKSLKNAKPPLLPGANILHTSTSTSVNLPTSNGNGATLGAQTGAGISKRYGSGGKKQARKTRDQRLRLEKAVQRAETVIEKMGKKIAVSRKRQNVVKERAGAWEEVNAKAEGRIVGGKKGRKEALLEMEGWEDVGEGDAEVDREREEEDMVVEKVGRLKVHDLGSSPDLDTSRQDEDEEDEIL